MVFLVKFFLIKRVFILLINYVFCVVFPLKKFFLLKNLGINQLVFKPEFFFYVLNFLIINANFMMKFLKNICLIAIVLIGNFKLAKLKIDLNKKCDQTFCMFKPDNCDPSANCFFGCFIILF